MFQKYNRAAQGIGVKGVFSVVLADMGNSDPTLRDLLTHP